MICSVLVSRRVELTNLPLPLFFCTFPQLASLLEMIVSSVCDDSANTMILLMCNSALLKNEKEKTSAFELQLTACSQHQWSTHSPLIIQFIAEI